MDKKELGAILYVMNTNYGKRLTPEESKAQARLWYANFGNLDAETLRAAVELHIKDKRVGMYYPNIAHITAKLERAPIASNLAQINAPRRAELAAGHTTPENNATIKWLESVFDNQGAGFYEDTDTPYTPKE